MKVICIGLLTKEDLHLEYDMMIEMENHALSEIEGVNRLDISCCTRRFNSPSDETIIKINQFIERIFDLYSNIANDQKYIVLYMRPQSNIGQISAYQLGYMIAYWQWHKGIDCQAYSWNEELQIWEAI